MSGLDNQGADKAVLAGTSLGSNLLCNIGYGDPSGVRPHSPRFSFDEVAKIV